MKLPDTEELIKLIDNYTDKNIPEVLKLLEIADFQRGRILFRFLCNFKNISEFVCKQFPLKNAFYGFWILELCRVKKIVEAVTFIEKTALDKELGLSFFCYRSLGELSDKSEFLLERLKSEKCWMIKKEILKALKGIHNEESCKYLFSIIHSSNSLLRLSLKDSLSENAGHLCNAFIEKINTSEMTEKLIAINLLGMNGDHSHVDVLIKHLSKATNKEEILCLIKAIGNLGNKSFQDNISKYLKSDEWIIRREASEAIGKWMPDVDAMIIETIECDENFLVREAFKNSCK